MHYAIIIAYGAMWLGAIVLAVAHSLLRRRHRHIGSYALLATIAAPLAGLIGLGIYAAFHPRPHSPEPLGGMPWLVEVARILAVSLGLSIPASFIANILLLRQPREHEPPKA
jgi:MFS family permease